MAERFELDRVVPDVTTVRIEGRIIRYSEIAGQEISSVHIHQIKPTDTDPEIERWVGESNVAAVKALFPFLKPLEAPDLGPPAAPGV